MTWEYDLITKLLFEKAVLDLYFFKTMIDNHVCDFSTKRKLQNDLCTKLG